MESCDLWSLSDRLDPALPLLGEADLGLCGDRLISRLSSSGRLWLLPGLSLLGELDVEAASGVKTCPLIHGLGVSLLPGALLNSGRAMWGPRFVCPEKTSDIEESLLALDPEGPGDESP